MANKIAIGVDVGGSHISSAAYMIEERKILLKTYAENKLDNTAPAEEIIAVWSQTIADTIEKTEHLDVSGIGFAMPGPFDYYNGIALFEGLNHKYESLYGLDISRKIRTSLDLPESFPVRFINDATAFAIGESIAGKAANARRCLAITLGTGFGSAFLNDKVPIVSGKEVPANGMVYHLPFENGTADDYFSTRGLLGRYQALTGHELAGVKELAAKAPGDLLVQEIFQDFGTKLGLFLLPWIKTFGVEVLVIGGNISKAFHLFDHSLKAVFPESLPNLEISISELKESASIIGSAALINDEYYESLIPALLNM
jgi:glucokinase